MAAVFLDSTVLIDLLRGRPQTVERLLSIRSQGDLPYTCAINIEEITRGLRPSENESVAALFEGLRIVPLGRVEGERAGLWRQQYAKQGLTLSQADCLIAAAATAIGARLMTGNPSDFPMPEIDLEHWPVGE